MNLVILFAIGLPIGAGIGMVIFVIYTLGPPRWLSRFSKKGRAREAREREIERLLAIGRLAKYEVELRGMCLGYKPTPLPPTDGEGRWK